MSELQRKVPQNAADLENFAYELGKHARKFSSSVLYRDFLTGLIEGLAADMKPPELNDLALSIARFAAQRAKEEKTGNVTHIYADGGSNSDDGGNDPSNLYDDFM
jgi:hypothetical protein